MALELPLSTEFAPKRRGNHNECKESDLRIARHRFVASCVITRMFDSVLFSRLAQNAGQVWEK
jgi:hypothetical protein